MEFPGIFTRGEIVPTIERPPHVQRLLSQLDQINVKIEEFGLNDQLSRDIAHWHRTFKEALESQFNYQEILNNFIGYIQELLRDGLGHPLDDSSYLGSDGRIYGHRSLCLLLNEMPRDRLNRSPLDLENPARFTVSPHHLARYLMSWLTQRQGRLHSEAINSAYDRLPEAQKSLPLGMNTQEMVANSPQTVQNSIERINANPSIASLDESRRRRIERILAIQQQRESESQRRESVVRETTLFLQNSVQPALQQIEQSAQESLGRFHERLNRLEQRDIALLERIRRDQDRLRTEIQELEIRNQELQELINHNQHELENAALDNIRLQMAINETRRIINERKSSSIDSFIGICVVIGACALATWAVPSLAGSTTTFIPLENGAKVTFSTFI